ncbi:acyltransferase family protein [Albidovulum sp.]
MRAIAVTMVVLFHVATRYPIAELDPVARQFLRDGFPGVDIFYPLSGFLITRFLLTHAEKGAIGTFFLRRFFRIVPLDLVAVTLFYVAARITGHDAAVIDRIWATYLFLTGWFAFFTGPDSVPYTITWSLSVEEFAYVILGLSAWLMRRQFPLIVLALAIAPIALRWHLYAAGYDNIYYFPLARLDSIATGGLVALLIGRVRNLWIWLAAATALAGWAWSLKGPLGATALFTTVTLATCTVICLCETALRGLRSALIDAAARVGLYSYFIYLFHFFILYAAFKAVDLAGIAMPGFWVMSAICMAGTFAASWLSFTFFEAPVMQFGRRLERSAPEAGEGAVTAAPARARP